MIKSILAMAILGLAIPSWGESMQQELQQGEPQLAQPSQKQESKDQKEVEPYDSGIQQFQGFRIEPATEQSANRMKDNTTWQDVNNAAQTMISEESYRNMNPIAGEVAQGTAGAGGYLLVGANNIGSKFHYEIESMARAIETDLTEGFAADSNPGKAAGSLVLVPMEGVVYGLWFVNGALEAIFVNGYNAILTATQAYGGALINIAKYMDEKACTAGQFQCGLSKVLVLPTVVLGAGIQATGYVFKFVAIDVVAERSLAIVGGAAQTAQNLRNAFYYAINGDSEEMGYSLNSSVESGTGAVFDFFFKWEGLVGANAWSWQKLNGNGYRDVPTDQHWYNNVDMYGSER